MTTAERWSLTAGDFQAATTQGLDEFVPASDDVMESKPGHPASWDDWLRSARCGINAWALVYGEEWRKPLTQCIDGLERLHEEHPTIFPKAVVQDTWEELHWRCWEELKEIARALKRPEREVRRAEREEERR